LMFLSCHMADQTSSLMPFVFVISRSVSWRSFHGSVLPDVLCSTGIVILHLLSNYFQNFTGSPLSLDKDHKRPKGEQNQKEHGEEVAPRHAPDAVLLLDVFLGDLHLVSKPLKVIISLGIRAGLGKNHPRRECGF
jgi:hypothetical protein